MGPYCNFCGTRCFVPTNENDYVKRDLKATCKEGMLFDLEKTFPRLLSKERKHIGFVVKRFYNEDFKTWDVLCLDMNGDEYSQNAANVEYHINTNVYREV